ncbi:TPA: acyltransferase family protein [Neisseria gonorrhoeae]
MQAVRYRPEIDGLRAVAVLSVIIFHLNNRWLPGGFLGVDIFFVISGFLITGIILSEIQNGSFSFRDFYTRRIKRIYPAFIAAVSLASVIASQIFLYEDFNQMRKTIELSTVFLSNIYLGFRLGYFDLSADENPVLHIWSLAVEEQYYLLYPLLLIFCCKKTKSLRALRHISIILFLILTATSFLPAAFYTDILNQPNTYYLSTLRFPELLVGSLLAGLRANAKRQTANRKWKTAVAFITLFRRIACLPVRDRQTRSVYPGNNPAPSLPADGAAYPEYAIRDTSDPHPVGKPHRICRQNLLFPIPVPLDFYFLRPLHYRRQTARIACRIGGCRVDGRIFPVELLFD